MNNTAIPTDTKSLLNATNIAGQLINAISSEHNSISEAEKATTNSGKEKISTFEDDDKRLIAQKTENEHEEKQTATREKYRTVRTGIIASAVMATVACVIALPLYISSKLSA